MTSAEIKDLQRFALQIRIGILDQIKALGFGHIGGSLSIADALAVLYGRVMRYDAKNPRLPQRDKLVCSKGHAGPAVYAALALKGFFPYEDLKLLNTPGTFLPSHCDKNLTPGVDMTAGSLGNGLSIGVGMALSARLHQQNYYTYVMMGDGEIQEGMVWEAAMAAAHHRLDNLVAMVDVNGIQINGWVNDIMRVEPLADKWRAFGWNVVECDGHDMRSVLVAFHKARAKRGAPTVILAATVKGKGVSYMADNNLWHGQAPNDAQTEEAIREINQAEEGL